MADLVGESFQKSRSVLVLFLLLGEKVRMRASFKNALNFKSNFLGLGVMSGKHQTSRLPPISEKGSARRVDRGRQEE
jgi:hypothetical protein